MKTDLLKLVLLITLLASFSQNSFSSIESFFVTPSKNYKSTNYKESLFSITTKQSGLFGENKLTRYLKMYSQINSSDNVVYLIIEYKNSSYLNSDIMGFTHSGLIGIEDVDASRFVNAILASVLYGRSKEFFKFIPDILSREKMFEDSENNDSIELVKRSTEIKKFRKYFTKLEKSTNIEEEGQDSQGNEESLLTGTIGKFLKENVITKGFSFVRDSRDRVLGSNFQRVVKNVKIGALDISFDSSTRNLSSVKHGDYQAYIDTVEPLIYSRYPKKIIFIRGEKHSSLSFEQVKSFRKNNLDISKEIKNLKKLGSSQINFVDLFL